jgi:hypothetical protein
LADNWTAFRRSIVSVTSIATAKRFFNKLDHPFWNFHYTLTADTSAKEMAVVGASRMADILANVVFAFWLSGNLDPSTELRKASGRNT